jgi:two-component system, chemotaxis family, sensor kinase Cph1
MEDRSERTLLAGIGAVDAYGVAALDAFGAVTSWNTGASLLTGYTARDALAGRFRDLVADQPEELTPSDLQSLADSGGETGIWLRRADGSRFWSMIAAAPVHAADGTLDAFLVMFHDASALKAEALAQQAEELARSNADLEQFAYVASHDLQEPLRMVASYTQLLARRYRDRLDDDADEFIGYAVDGVTRMQALINDLLAYSRVGSRAELVEPVELEEVLAPVLERPRPAIEETGATVTHDPLPAVTGDAVQLGQLLQNLMANAIKFRGEEPPRVHVSAERGDDVWVVLGADNGIGISPEHAGAHLRHLPAAAQPGRLPGNGDRAGDLQEDRGAARRPHLGGAGAGGGSDFYFTLPEG